MNILFAHTPKAAGAHLINYFKRELQYPTIQSSHTTTNDVWCDFTLDQILENVDAEHAFLPSHTLAFGWSQLVSLIPFAEKARIIDAIGLFRSKGWFTFTFVRHPGDLLTSFYHYILDSHERGWHDAVALHAPAVGCTLESFVSEHCEKELLPDYWHVYDYANVANDTNLETFFSTHFDHQYKPNTVDRHASGSRGYAHYCAVGEISAETQNRIDQSRNMQIYREILEAQTD